jgi:hypothetical protein
MANWSSGKALIMAGIDRIAHPAAGQRETLFQYKMSLKAGSDSNTR